MKIVNEQLLAQYRTPGRCEICGKWCSRREPHHIHAKGFGGGGRLDVAVNLVAVGASRPFPFCLCHGRIHDGKIKRPDLLVIVARREQTTVEAIEAEIYRLRRLPKGAEP